jgi:retron-type reverse transcriptase
MVRFLQVAWDIIRPDLMVVLDVFWCHDTRDLHATNEALMILLPKSTEVEAIKEYKPISLIHSVDKLISKLLVNYLAPKIESLIHGTQCAFIKGRSIHEKFIFVHAFAKLLHSRRKATILFKVDLSKAFDSVTWAFLMEVL